MWPTFPLNTVLRLPDGRVGTTCYNALDGCGGVWGRHTFTMPDGGFGDELPRPDFLLRPPDAQVHRSLTTGRMPHKPALELVGVEVEVVSE